ncbi:MAG: hypothetical protein K2O38_02340 [Muribaculaceae bacterium]|nr:hypothetical protein [Muribaculaceae bacterium]
MNNITELFESLLNSFRSIDLANRELHRMIAEDAELNNEYTDWCIENGYTERYGFIEFAEIYIENQNSIWDSLTDYDDQE